MSDNQLIETLNERIKELTCLYEISNISADSSLTLDHQLQSIVRYLPKAWRYSDRGIAELRLDAKTFFSGKPAKKCVSQKCKIKIEGKERGYLALHYDASVYDQSAFLPEEQTLLKTLSQEVSGIIARSEQKKREGLLNRQIQQSDRLAILGEITAGIAHELNTPLGNILGFSQLIQERSKDKQINNDIEKIISSVIHSREIVKKLMFFSCEMPQQMSRVPINPLIQEALELLKITLKNAQVTAKFEGDQNEIKAQVDPIQFTQVVFNLLINAIHASDAGKEIQIKLERNTNSFRLSIEDQGHGISEDIQGRIFEPFFSTKATGEGSGLGLSVVHGIVKSHGGNIAVSSELNKGATFMVDIPLSQVS